MRESRRPLHCLLFLLPWVAWHELGVLWLRSRGELGRDLLVPISIHEVFGWLGFSGFWVPGLALVLIVLVWHRLRHDRWRVRAWVFPPMLAESLLLTVPLLAVSALFPQRSEAITSGLYADFLRALGAGIYEELVFRLLLISALAWLLAGYFRVQTSWASWLAVVIAAVVFSICHFQPVGWEAFRWGPFWFRLIAGLYLSVVFVERGLGVSGGCHAAFNVVLVWLYSE